MGSSSHPQTYSIHILPPPGPSVLAARQILGSRIVNSSTDTAPADIHPLFLAAAKVREEVFVHEQKCSASEEIDADDAISVHWVIFASSDNASGDAQIPAATVRLVPSQSHVHSSDAEADVAATTHHLSTPKEPYYKGSHFWDGKEQFVKIGRLATVKACRGRGYGRILVEELIQWASEHPKEVKAAGDRKGEWKGLIGAHAQTSVKEWYQKLGFVVDEGMGVWWEEGIEHVGIWKRVDVTG